MPSTFSPNKGYELMATGEDNNVWGDKTNDNLGLIDKNLGSLLTKAIVSTAVTLTADECENLGIFFFGTLTGNTTVTFPARGGYYVVYNGTSGTFRLRLVSAGGGDPIDLGAGDHLTILAAPNNLYNAQSPIPAGMIMGFAGQGSPDGAWLICGGQDINRTVYSSLFGAIGTLWGTGNGTTTFGVPDLRGRTLVGRDTMGGTAANRVNTAGSGINATTAGATGGFQNITLVNGNIPAFNTGTESQTHTHPLTITTAAAGVVGGAVAVYTPLGSTPASGGISLGTESRTHVHSAGSGSPSAHNNMPPAGVVNWWIKV